MRPVMFSVREAEASGGEWRRFGHDICYHKNQYTRSLSEKKKRLCHRYYYTLSFSFQFPHEYDVVYMAYHYPYPYTRLQVCFSLRVVSHVFFAL